MNTNYLKYLKILIGLVLVGCIDQRLTIIQPGGNQIGSITGDRIPPVITVAGYTNGQTTNVIKGEGFVIPEATAIDDIDGSVAVRINHHGYNNNRIGIYGIKYSASDSVSNTDVFSFRIIVGPDIIPPVITVAGFTNGQSTNVAAGDGFAIPEATATDNADDSVLITINGGGYNNYIPNTYTVVYTAEDNDGNFNNFMIRIIVGPDIIPPVITVIGFTNGQTTNVAVGDGFAIPQATAIDNVDGHVAVTTNESGYDNNITNTYTVVYTAEDNAGNSNAFMIVIIVEDKTPPVITVAGFNNGQMTNVENGEGFVIPEATALDNVDGLVAVITNEDEYDNNVVDSYTVVYTSVDIAGNSNAFTIVIIVEDIYDEDDFHRETGIHRNVTKILANDGRAFDNFGVSVSIDGDYAIVGAYFDDDNGINSGSAYIFNRSGGDWIQQAKLIASDGGAFDYFGVSVSIDGDYAIVGAYFDDDNGINSGSAYIFNRSGGDWIQQAKLIASDGDTDDNFGVSVAIDGDYMIVGAHLDGVNDVANSGSAYIFTRSGRGWIEQAKLIASDGDELDNFGYSVSIDGDYAIVGAYSDDDNGRNNGSAYIFNRQGTNWSEQKKITANDDDVLDLFGYSVAIDGDYAIVGAYFDDDNGINSGSAYIFNRSGSDWIQQAKLIASDGDELDNFGYSVSIDGDYAIVGAFLDDDNGINSGSAYIFNRSGSDWIQQAKLIASDGDELDNFGISVAIDGDYVIVGAFLDDDITNGKYSGSAYIYELRR